MIPSHFFNTESKLAPSTTRRRHFSIFAALISTAQPFVLRRAMSTPAKRGVIAAAEGIGAKDIQTSKRHKAAAAQPTAKSNGKVKPKTKATSSQEDPKSSTVDIEDCVLPPADQVAFRQALLDWYDEHRRRLPWRGDPPPYVSSLEYRTQATAAASTGGRGVGCSDDLSLNSGKKTAAGTKATSSQASNQANQSSLLSFFSAKPATKAVTSNPASADVAASEDTAGGRTLSSSATLSTPPSPPTSSSILAIDSTIAAPEAPAVSAYGTWVCEVMSQQTRIETVVDYWTKWMKQFPTVAALAAATPEKVNAAWAGLGYYRRARSLHAGAIKCVEELNGELPNTAEALQRLIPGVGPYTAGAIASIAFQEATPLVDGNVVRVFARLHAMDHTSNGQLSHAAAAAAAASAAAAAAAASPAEIEAQTLARAKVNQEDEPVKEEGGGVLEERDEPREVHAPVRDPNALLKPAWALAGGLLDQDRPGDYNQALMELGATVCTPRAPRCEACPVAALCRARGLQQRGLLADVSLYPAKPIKKAPAEHTFLVLVLSRSAATTAPADNASSPAAATSDSQSKDSDSGIEGRKQYLMVQRPDSGLLAGQWEFPAAAIVTDEVIKAGASDEEENEGPMDGGSSPSSKISKSKSAKRSTGSNSKTSNATGSTNLLPNAEKLAGAAKALASVLMDDLKSSSEFSSSNSNGSCNGNGNETSKESTNSVLPMNLLALAAHDPHIPAKVKAAAEAAQLLRTEVHLFSHQRHTMHILPAEIVLPSDPAKDDKSSAAGSSCSSGSKLSTLESSDAVSVLRSARWMDEAELAQVGVTTGMRKVLAKAAKPTEEPATPVSKNLPKQKVSKYFQ